MHATSLSSNQPLSSLWSSALSSELQQSWIVPSLSPCPFYIEKPSTRFWSLQAPTPISHSANPCFKIPTIEQLSQIWCSVPIRIKLVPYSVPPMDLQSTAPKIPVWKLQILASQTPSIESIYSGSSSSRLLSSDIFYVESQPAKSVHPACFALISIALFFGHSITLFLGSRWTPWAIESRSNNRLRFWLQFRSLPRSSIFWFGKSITRCSFQPLLLASNIFCVERRVRCSVQATIAIVPNLLLCQISASQPSTRAYGSFASSWTTWNNPFPTSKPSKARSRGTFLLLLRCLDGALPWSIFVGMCAVG